MSTRSVLAGALFASALGVSVVAAGEEPRFAVGVRGAYDVVPDSLGEVRFPSAEIFLRVALSPTFAAEGSFGRRHYSYVQNGGYNWGTYAMDQAPIFLGAVYLASPGEVFRPSLAGGLAVVPTSFERSSYHYPTLTNTSGSSTELIPWVGAGFSVHLRDSAVMLDFGARYVFGSDASYAADSPSQRYIRLQLGLGYRF